MKTYTDAEINSLIEELQNELPALLKAEQAANAELAKGEAGGSHTPIAPEVAGGPAVPQGTKMADVTNGANGGDQKGATITAGKAKGGGNQPSPAPASYLSASIGKTGSGSASAPSAGLSKQAPSFAKADGPPPKSAPADDEGGDSGGDSGDDSSGPPPSASGGEPATDSASAPPVSASPDAPSAAPADPSADPAAMGADQMGGGDPLGELKQAYAALPDQELQMHFEALKDAVMSRMGGDQQAGGSPVGAPDPSAMGGAPAGAPPMADMSPPPPASPPPSPSPSASAGGPPPPPAQKAQPAMGMGKSDELSKAQDEKIANLERSLEGVTSLLESILTKPVQKSVTSMAEFMAKSEAEKPVAAKLSKSELLKKAADKAKMPDLKKSDRDVINRYVLSGEGLADLEKLLAS